MSTTRYQVLGINLSYNFDYCETQEFGNSYEYVPNYTMVLKDEQGRLLTSSLYEVFTSSYSCWTTATEAYVRDPNPLSDTNTNAIMEILHYKPASADSPIYVYFIRIDNNDRNLTYVSLSDTDYESVNNVLFYCDQDGGDFYYPHGKLKFINGGEDAPILIRTQVPLPEEHNHTESDKDVFRVEGVQIIQGTILNDNYNIFLSKAGDLNRLYYILQFDRSGKYKLVSNNGSLYYHYHFVPKQVLNVKLVETDQGLKSLRYIETKWDLSNNTFPKPFFFEELDLVCCELDNTFLQATQRCPDLNKPAPPLYVFSGPGKIGKSLLGQYLENGPLIVYDTDAELDYPTDFNLYHVIIEGSNCKEDSNKRKRLLDHLEEHVPPERDIIQVNFSLLSREANKRRKVDK